MEKTPTDNRRKWFTTIDATNIVQWISIHSPRAHAQGCPFRDMTRNRNVLSLESEILARRWRTSKNQTYENVELGIQMAERVGRERRQEQAALSETMAGIFIEVSIIMNLVTLASSGIDILSERFWLILSDQDVFYM
jgi:hypothetical protein